ncbi:calcium-binding protein [Jannaschia sp. M317]|uniref:calcium-binding protein n=1 Tax=Jannaschia sp. M317 TaxID=2867011 RepID=UPI0021A699B7|nr:calcium-binding protein [Jannaschia sp. M317]UWQ19644.1 hypothetical protein K3551_18280 [Jannaschia sp. M317]
MTDIPDSTTSPARLAPGGSYTGTYETRGDQDAVGLELEGGVTYRVTLDRGQLDNTVLGDVQTLVAHHAQDVIHLSPRTDGTVFARLWGREDFRDITGPYTLTLSEVTGDLSPWPEQAPILELGGRLPGALDFNGDDDRIGFMVEAGQSYRISVLSTGPELAARAPDLPVGVLLQNPDGTRIDDAERLFRGNDSFITYTAQTSGRIDLTVDESYSIPTAYEVRFDTFTDLPPLLTTPATLAVGEAVQGVFEYRVDADAYAIELETGISYAFTLEQAGNSVWLYNSAGRLVNFATGANVTLEASVAASGTFYLQARTGEANDGAYTLRADVSNEIPASPATEAVLPVGTPVRDQLHGRDADWYGITLEADTTYRASYGALNGLAVRLSVHDAAGETLLEETRGPREVYSEAARDLVFSSAAVPGAAFLGLSNSRFGVQNYTLLLEEVADAGQTDAGAATLAVGEDRRGHLFQGDVDRFAVTLPQGPDAATAYLVSVTGEGFGTRPVLAVNGVAPGAEIAGVTGDATAWQVVQVGPDPAPLSVDVSEATGPRGQTGTPFYNLRVDAVDRGTEAAERMVAAPERGIVAGGGDDTLVGRDAGDILWGGRGDDLIFGLQGDDHIRGGTGNDTLQLGAGDDIATGGVGRDLLVGHGGDDNLAGGAGSDVLIGGAGDDTLNGGADADALTGGAGADAFYLMRDAGARDWIADYDQAEGDVLVLDPAIFNPNISRGVFLRREAIEGVGDADTDEIVVVARGRFFDQTQDIAVLVDGADIGTITLRGPDGAFTLEVSDLPI